MTCYCLALLFAMPAAAPVEASLEGHEREPYRMLIELRLSEDPVFTEFLKKAVARELRDQLSNFFADLAEVEVSDEGKLWEKLGRRPLGELTATSLSALAGVGPWDKAFLVNVDCDSGVYRIQWRQLSLEAGHLGPVASRQTADRYWLAKAICLAVKDDFAPVATVSPRGEEVDLKFRGAAFRVGEGAGAAPRLAAWLSDRTLLEPLRVTRNRDGSLARTPISHTVVMIESGGGFSRGRVISPWVDPLKLSARVAGFQAIRLRTQKGHFAIRVLNAETGDPVPTCSVYASSDRFSAEAADAFHPTIDGWVAPLMPFERAAYVTIAQSGGPSFKFILPITSERCTQECRVRIDERAGGKSDLQRRLRYVGQDVRILHASLDASVREVNRLHEGKRYEEAMKRAKAACDEVGPQRGALEKVLAELKSEGRKLQVPDSFFAATDQQVAELRGRLDSLRTTAESLDRLVNSIDVSNKAKVLLGLADDAIQSLDFSEAIAKYEEALQQLEKLPEQYANRQETKDQVAKIRQVVGELRRAWERTDEDLVKARAVITDTVAKGKLRGIEAGLPQARDAMKTLQKYDDYLTARMLVKVLDDVLLEIGEMAEVLEGRGGREDLADLSKYTRLGEEVSSFRQEIVRWLESRRSGGQPGAPPDRGASPSPDASAPARDGKSPQPEPAAPRGKGKSPASDAAKPPPRGNDKRAPEAEEEAKSPKSK